MRSLRRRLPSSVPTHRPDDGGTASPTNDIGTEAISTAKTKTTVDPVGETPRSIVRIGEVGLT